MIVGKRNTACVKSAWNTPAKRVLHLVKNGCARFSEDNASGNNDRDLGPRIRRADNKEFAGDASSSLAHSLETEVTVFAMICNCGIDANAIVPHAHRQVLPIAQADF